MHAMVKGHKYELVPTFSEESIALFAMTVHTSPLSTDPGIQSRFIALSTGAFTQESWFRLADKSLNEQLRFYDIFAPVRDELEHVSGLPYRTLARLCGWAYEGLAGVDGALLLRGVDLFTMPIHRAVRVLLALRFENVEEKNRDKTIYELDRPLPHEIREIAQEESRRSSVSQEESDMFLKALTMTGGSVT